MVQTNNRQYRQQMMLLRLRHPHGKNFHVGFDRLDEIRQQQRRFDRMLVMPAIALLRIERQPVLALDHLRQILLWNAHMLLIVSTLNARPA